MNVPEIRLSYFEAQAFIFTAMPAVTYIWFALRIYNKEVFSFVEYREVTEHKCLGCSMELFHWGSHDNGIWYSSSAIRF